VTRTRLMNQRLRPPVGAGGLPLVSLGALFWRGGVLFSGAEILFSGRPIIWGTPLSAGAQIFSSVRSTFLFQAASSLARMLYTEGFGSPGAHRSDGTDPPRATEGAGQPDLASTYYRGHGAVISGGGGGSRMGDPLVKGCFSTKLARLRKK